ncbi:MAG: cytochrome c family protein [Micavibrio sp.]|nr:cytochrome c family protein [Micavibrio sp.]|tara:strand:+ start:2217 stop:2822 length:606 start_codon:yes stop_codon:yes gene_type:complete
MNSFEINKILGAIVLAVVTALAAGFIGGFLVKPEMLDTDVVPISGGNGVVIAKKTGPDPIMHLIATADITQGQKIAKACMACHDFSQGGPNKTGPNQWGIVGDDIAAKASFNYSDALKALEGKWDYDELNHFLWKPKKHAPGTKMTYNGLRKPEDRAAVIAWLRQQGSSSYPLPTAAQIEDEKQRLAPPPPPPAEEPATAE